MHAEIFAIGTELLMGEIVDTNSAYMATRLPALGIELRQIRALGDDLGMLTDAFRSAWQRSELVLATGGLGPTQDDLTREAIAQALGEPLTIDSALKAEQEAYWSSRRLAMPPSNLRQSVLIPSAVPIPNPHGSAPGWWVEKNGHVIVSMPGVPHEFYQMWQDQVVPRLLKMPRGHLLISRTIKTFGQSESAMDDTLHHLFGKENPYLGIYAKPDGIHLRIIAKARNKEEGKRLIEPVEQEIERLIPDLIWGYDDQTPEERVGEALRRTKTSLATMESCTSGLLASTITDVPGSSDYFRGGFVTYTNEVKIAQGVPAPLIAQYGAVSTQVAEAMAQAARTNIGADFGVGVTGVAGPGESEGKPPGTVYIGLAWKGGARSITARLRFDRQLIKRRSVTQALLELRRLINEVHHERLT
ncbi:MAG: competence/damage-inducible protein A [Dehalococcoidia bacterium]|nr:competence/damage-inducible protein A [Dehalococcoidia bacterium]